MSTEPKPMDPERLASIANLFSGDERIEDLIKSHDRIAWLYADAVKRADAWMSRAAKSGAGLEREAELRKHAQDESTKARARAERAERERDDAREGYCAAMAELGEADSPEEEAHANGWTRPSCAECVTMGAACRSHGHWARAEPQPEDAPKDDYTIVTPMGAAVRAARPTPDPIDTPGVHHHAGATKRAGLSTAQAAKLREYMETQPPAPEPDPDPEVNVARFDESCEFDDWADEKLGEPGGER